MLITRQRPLNKSNKIDIIPFSKLNDNLGNSTPTNGMGKWHNLRLQVTYSCTYGTVKNDNFLRCVINLQNCSCHPHDDDCSYSTGRASVVTSYNLKSQITKGPSLQGVLWDFGGFFGGSVKSSRRRTNRWGSAACLSIRRERGGSVNETVGRQWCTAQQAHKAGHQLTSEAQGNRQGLYDHHQI